MPGLHAHELRALHDPALSFHKYLSAYPEKAGPWRDVEADATLNEAQRALVASFRRRMPVLVISGIWCGDCSAQGPLLHRIAEASDVIDLRFAEREDVMELAEKVKINDGLRVPTVIFMAEDYEFVSVVGDRTLARYRMIAQKKLGAACPLPGAAEPAGSRAATLQEWLDRFEHAQLVLRLSTRLRQLHGD